jgi:hypothetical protein
MKPTKPLLFLDVDGVVGVWDFRDHNEVEMLENPDTGRGVCVVPKGIKNRLERLAEVFEPVWVTAWFTRANDILYALGLDPWEVLFWGQTKLADIPARAGKTPWVFVDDEIGFELRGNPGYTEQRNTLLYNVDGKVGLTDKDTDFLVQWAFDHT